MNQKIIEIDFWQVIATIDREMNRVGWDSDRGKAHLQAKYGTHTRFKLTDRQLLEFKEYLETLPKAGKNLKVKGVRKIRDRLNFPMNKKSRQASK